MRPWEDILIKRLWSRPGQHLLINGNTGSGKSQVINYCGEAILTYGKGERLLVNDRAKSSEILTWALMRPLNLIIPQGCQVHIHIKDKDGQLHKLPEEPAAQAELLALQGLQPIHKTYIKRFVEVWQHLEADKINILVIRPFIRKKKDYAAVIAGIFEELLDLAGDYRLPVPLCIIWDEFHEVAPSSGDKFGVSELLIAQLEDLRSKMIRFIASSHGWTKMVRGARISFPNICAKRGTVFEKENLRLRKFNPVFEALQPWESIFIFDDKTFTDKLELPHYTEGDKLGRVTYSCPFMQPSSCRDLTIESIYQEG